MVPLIKRSSDILVERMGTIAESGESAELFRSVKNRLNREKTPTAYTSLLLRVTSLSLTLRSVCMYVCMHAGPNMLLILCPADSWHLVLHMT